MAQKFVNAGRFELLSPLTSAGTTLNLLSGAALPPATAGTGALTSGDWFRLVLQDADQIEVVAVRTHVSGSDQLTNVLRGQEGTTARDWPAGTVVGNRWTAADADTAVNGKVDKETGKGLSSSDFTAAEKTKLAGVAIGATANSTDGQLRDRSTHTGITPISGGGTGANTIEAARAAVGMGESAFTSAVSFNDYPMGTTRNFSGSNTDAVALGAPDLGGSAAVIWITTTVGTGSRAVQRASQVYGPVRNFMRARQDASWSAWREEYSTHTILGAVAQVAGIPTGAIIQRGSNANGEFVRFADGTQICSREIVIASREYAAGAAYEWGNWTFPAAFLVRPVIPAPGDHGGWSQDFRVTAEYADTTTLGQVTVKNIGSVSRTQARYVSLMAIGRWF